MGLFCQYVGSVLHGSLWIFVTTSVHLAYVLSELSIFSAWLGLLVIESSANAPPQYICLIFFFPLHACVPSYKNIYIFE